MGALAKQSKQSDAKQIKAKQSKQSKHRKHSEHSTPREAKLNKAKEITNNIFFFCLGGAGGQKTNENRQRFLSHA